MTTACSPAMRKASRWWPTGPTVRSRPRPRPASSRRSRAHSSCPTAVRARPVFELLAGKYLDPRYAPAAVAERTGIEASTIIRIAAEIAEAAFDREVIVEQPWTDMKGERHERMIGRPVAFHAMRGISASFQRLPDGARPAPAADPGRLDRLPRRFSLQAALSAPCCGTTPAAWRRLCRHGARGPASGLSARARGPAARGRRRDCAAHRQGLLLGCAACRPTG